jgi:GDP-L-fucose synthase
MNTFIAGHRGMVGSAIERRLRQASAPLVHASREELDLRDSAAVDRFFAAYRPRVVYLAAAVVGGIQANIDAPFQFLHDNLMIECNVLRAAAAHGVEQFCFLGSSCVYPRLAPQPMTESALLTGPLEPTNEGYALAKIAGIRMAQYLARETPMRILCPIPCNLYGPGDNFDLRRSHVMAALVRKFSDAVEQGESELTLWGTGTARREFLHVDDLARALELLMEAWPSPDIINVGSGEDVTIADLAARIAERVGYRGAIRFDPSKPDGMPRKCLDVSKLRSLGFRPEIDLNAGIEGMIEEYRKRGRP